MRLSVEKASDRPAPGRCGNPAIPGLLVLVCLSVVWLAAGPAWSAQAALDVVLVLDSSGSMKQNDPGNLRQEAAKLFISLLSRDDRVAVVSFADAAEVFEPFRGAAEGPDRKRLFRAIGRVNSRGKHTDILSGLRRAFDLHAAEPPAGQERVIVLMTDGKVDTGDPGRDRTTTESLRGELSRKLKEKKIPVYSLAFTRKSDIRLLEEVSFGTDGYMAVAQRSDELHETFIQFFERLKEPEGTPVVGNAFRVDEAVQEATLIARKSSPDVDVELVQPDQTVVSRFGEGTDFVRFSTEAYDLITLRHPEAGEWTIRFSHGDGNRVVLITNLKLETSFGGAFLSKDMRVPVEAYLTRDGELLNDGEVIESTRFSLARLGPGAEDVHTGELFDDGREGDGEAGDAIFSGELLVPEAGSYKLSLRAEGKTFSRVKEIAFRVTDWWLAPNLTYETVEGQGVLLLELEKRFSEVPMEDFEMEAALRAGDGTVPLTFTESEGRYTASAPRPLEAGEHVVELRIRPVLAEGPTHWIAYPDLGFTVEPVEGATPAATVEGHQEPPPEQDGETGWGGALLMMLVFNLVLGGSAFGAIFVRKRLQLRRSTAEADAA